MCIRCLDGMPQDLTVARMCPETKPYTMLRCRPARWTGGATRR